MAKQKEAAPAAERPAATTPEAAPARRKKAKRMVAEGVVHIHSTFNNTIITISDAQGNVVAWSSAGSVGFKGSRKGTPFAAQLAAEAAAKKAMDFGLRSVQVYVKGITGETLLLLLEKRLDNMVDRMGFATSRAEARQLVRHGHFLVDGKKVDIPSYLLEPGQVLTVAERSRSVTRILEAMEQAER